VTNKELRPWLRDNLTPIATALGCSLADIVLAKEGPQWVLRLVIDKPEGVGVGDCEAVSRAVERFLDEDDPIPYGYVLEVNSPGIDRPLRTDEDFERFKGKKIDVRLFSAIDKHKNFQGVLLSKINDMISIQIDGGKVMEFPQAGVASCKLAVILDGEDW